MIVEFIVGTAVLSHDVKQDEPLAKKEQKEKPWIDSDGFTKEEVTAMCVVALSLVDVKVYNPKDMMKFMHEHVGIEEDEVYYKMHNLITEMPQAMPVVKTMDVSKRSIAAAFFAASIQAVSYADDKDAVLGWRNCTKYLLLLNDADCDFEKSLQRYDKSLINKQL